MYNSREYYEEQKRIINSRFPTQRDVYIVTAVCVIIAWAACIAFYFAVTPLLK